MIYFRYRLKRSIDKTLPDLSRVLTGRAPGFVYGGAVRGLPVFTYHVVDSSFENDLRHLSENRYRTVTVDELNAWQEGRFAATGKEVMLTFDDGDRSLTEVAAPLMQKYGFNGLAFVVAGLVPESTDSRMAGWDALQRWVAAGVLEIGAHSVYHHHVPVSPQPIGFVTPDTNVRFEADIPIPRIDGGAPTPLGYPILKGRPRYTAARAFHPEPDSLARFEAAAADAGEAFFSNRDWLRILQGLGPVEGRFETAEESDAAAVEDLARSMEIVESRCPNPGTRQVCYPWYAGDRRTDRLAHRAGVERVFMGIDRTTEAAEDGAPNRIGRQPEEFLPMLPGGGRKTLGSWARERFGGLAGGPKTH